MCCARGERESQSVEETTCHTPPSIEPLSWLTLALTKRTNIAVAYNGRARVEASTSAERAAPTTVWFEAVTICRLFSACVRTQALERRLA